MPIGVWSTSSTRSNASQPVSALQPNGSTRLRRRCARAAPQVREEHVARKRALAAAGHAGDDGQPLERNARAHIPSGCAAAHRRRRSPASGRSYVRGGPADGPSGAARNRPVIDAGEHIELRRGALRDDPAAAAARTRTEIDDVVGAADRVLVVLDDDERVALCLELRQRVEQDAIVARVQADRRLVEDVADAAQIRAELCGEPDALRLAAGERRRRAIEREIAKPDVIEKGEPRSELREDVASDLGLATAQVELPPRRRAASATRKLRQLGRSSVPCMRTASASGLRRAPRQAGQTCRPRRTIRSTPISSSVCSASKPSIFNPVP